jgi:hypothetical protein
LSEQERKEIEDVVLTLSFFRPSMAGDFVIGMNGPIPTVLDQIGTSTADLDEQREA